MADQKKFYWLKLQKDFFERQDIQIVEAMPNGKDYILFYLKLLCKSVEHDGILRFNEQIPYSEEMLATITRTNIDLVRSSVGVFTQLHMMELWDDGTLFMNEVDNMIGSAVDNDNANRQRRFRERKKQLELQDRYASVTKSNESKSIEIDIDIDKELEIDKEIEKDNKNTNMHIFADEFEMLWSRYPKKRGKQKAQDAYIRHRKKGVSYETISQGLNNYIEYIKESKTDTQYIKDGSTWFRNQCWDDDYQVKHKLSKIEEWGMA